MLYVSNLHCTVNFSFESLRKRKFNVFPSYLGGIYIVYIEFSLSSLRLAFLVLQISKTPSKMAATEAAPAPAVPQQKKAVKVRFRF